MEGNVETRTPVLLFGTPGFYDIQNARHYAKKTHSWKLENLTRSQAFCEGHPSVRSSSLFLVARSPMPMPPKMSRNGRVVVTLRTLPPRYAKLVRSNYVGHERRATHHAARVLFLASGGEGGPQRPHRGGQRPLWCAPWAPRGALLPGVSARPARAILADPPTGLLDHGQRGRGVPQCLATVCLSCTHSDLHSSARETEERYHPS